MVGGVGGVGGGGGVWGGGGMGEGRGIGVGFIAKAMTSLKATLRLISLTVIITLFPRCFSLLLLC